MSRSTLIILTSSLAVSACVSGHVRTFSKANTNQATVSRAEAACRVEANNLFPAANYPVVHSTGGYVGGWGAGWGLGGMVTTTDVNASMRSSHYHDCMHLKGYSPVTHPVCPEGLLKERRFQPAPVVPPAGPQYCAAPTSNGGYVILDVSNPL